VSESSKGAVFSYKLINYIFAGIIVMIFTYSGIFSPQANNYPVSCIHEQITGLSCPSCGMSHSFSYIIRGDIKEAVDWNIYGPRVFLFFLFQLIMRISILVLLKRKPQLIRTVSLYDISISILSVGLGFWQFAEYYIKMFSA
jgi:hypothetical protein